MFFISGIWPYEYYLCYCCLLYLITFALIIYTVKRKWYYALVNSTGCHYNDVAVIAQHGMLN